MKHKNIKVKRITNDLIYARKTRWGWVAVGVCISTILACYIPRIANGADVAPSRNYHGDDRCPFIDEIGTDLQTCVKIAEGAYDCSEPADRAKWIEYLEGRIKKYEKQDRVGLSEVGTEEYNGEVSGDGSFISDGGKRVLWKTVTGFNSVPEQTDESPCLSADGSNICELEAHGDHSCASNLPFGTRISVPDLGVCTVRDRLAPKYSYRVDWYFGGRERVADALQWGKRYLEVTILN